MIIVVPDASVILKWVLQRNEGADMIQAFALQEAFLSEQVDFRVPALWRYEVGNILGLKQPDLAGELLHALLDYEFHEMTLTREIGQAVLKLMKEIKGISFYDGCYHAMAIQTNGVYVTADREYTKKAERKGHIALLSEWKTS